MTRGWDFSWSRLVVEEEPFVTWTQKAAKVMMRFQLLHLHRTEKERRKGTAPVLGYVTVTVTSVGRVIII